MSGIYFPSPSVWIAFSACFFGWAAFELLVNLRRWQGGSANRDKFSRYLIIVGMLLAFALAVNATRAHAFDVTALRPQVFYSGLALMIGGLALRLAAIWHLGRFFTAEVVIQPGQRLISAGLYRHVRHPSYTGTLISVLGCGLALTNWLSLLIMVGIAAVPYSRRMQLEERALEEAFGDEYRDYMRRTKRLIPLIY